MRDAIVFLLGLSLGLLVAGFLIPVPGYNFQPVGFESTIRSYTVFLYRWDMKDKASK